MNTTYQLFKDAFSFLQVRQKIRFSKNVKYYVLAPPLLSCESGG